jgi:hypothetical protein
MFFPGALSFIFLSHFSFDAHPTLLIPFSRTTLLLDGSLCALDTTDDSDDAEIPTLIPEHNL